MTKGMQGEQRGHNMEEMQPRDNHLEVGKSDFFHNHKIQIQDHSVVVLVHTSSTSQRTKKTGFM
jgi:hypothetical protein